MKKIYIFFIFLMVAGGCTSQKTMQNIALIVSMNKSGCMGECPVYNLNIYENGWAEFEGKKYTEKIGVYRTEISKEKLERLISLFVENNFFELEDRYVSQRTDLPTTTLYFAHEGKTKKVIDYDKAPTSLKELEREVEQLMKEEKWKKMNE